MRQNEEKNNAQQSLEISHNQTLTHLVHQSKEKININEFKSQPVISQSGQELINLFRIDNQDGEKKNIVKVQSRKIFVQSSQQKNNDDYKTPPHKEYQKKYTTQFHRQLENREFPILRSRTMINSEKIYQESSDTIKHKLPLAILQYITSNAKLKRLPSGNATKTQAGKKLGQLGLSKKLTKKYNTKKCQICETEVPQTQFQKMTKNCQHSYCSSCLHHYVIYKINAFQAVQCPNESCNQPLDQESQLYEQLPLQVRKKYKKLLQYEMVKEHPNRKMCPSEKCQGWIEIGENLDPVCSVCKKIYCPKCLLPHHEGDCDNKQLQFFQGTLHYRQCNKCKNVIQKSSGCIHMTCRCGYQFCYLCGGKWNHSHTCNNPDQQRLHHQENHCCCCCQMNMCDFDCDDCCDDCSQRFCEIVCCCCDNGGCCNCDCDCQCCGCDCQCCDCCDLDNCPGIRCILQFLFKALMFIIWIGVLFPVIVVADFLCLGIFWTVVTFLSGFTLYTIEVISQLEGICFVLSIIFYPVTSFAGIVLAFRQVFVEVYLAHVVQMMEGLCESFHDIMND